MPDRTPETELPNSRPRRAIIDDEAGVGTVEPAEEGTEETAEPEAAAEPDTATPGPRTAREIAADFVRPGRAQILIAIIMLICGLAVTMQLRTRSQDESFSTLRRADLIEMLDNLNAESRRLESEITDMEETRRQLKSGADSERVAREEAERRLEVLSILAGTVPAKGPGIRLTITDPQSKVTPEILLNAIEEMRDAGAEVIEINNSIRVVASTWVSSGPGGLIVDDQVVTRPIVLEIIGESHALSEAARFRGGLVSEVQDERIGGRVAIETVTELSITALHTPPANRFARPA